VRLSAEVERIRGSDKAVAVWGEAGAGRTAVAAEIVGDRSAEWLDALTIAFDGTARWLGQLTSASRGGCAVLVIEHAESLLETVIPGITQLIASQCGPRVILTACPVSDLPSSVAALVSLCPERLDIPPLRSRRPEFVQIAQAMLTKLDAAWRLTPAALAALLAADWPGNLREFAAVLKSSAASAAHGEIDISDLPARYRRTDRVAHLGGRERAERQAIIDALAAAGGNKVYAAAALGISRSTLYARMRALRIDSA
jgi:DNA-binding NtrC family response regulator